MSPIKIPIFVPMATMYVLLGFDGPPPPGASQAWLLASCCRIARTIGADHLPYGSFEALGMHEEWTWFEEIITSQEYDDAVRGSRQWVNDNLEIQPIKAGWDFERIDRQIMRNRIMLFDAGIMDDDEIERLDLEEPRWRSADRRRWLDYGG